MYTARRPVHGRVHSRVHTHTCTPPLQGRVRAIYTAVYTARTRLCKCSCTRAAYTARRVHGRRPTGPCTRSQTARYRRVRPVTAVYTARSRSVYGRVRRPLHGRPTRAYVYTAVKRPCTRHVHVRVHGQYTVVYMVGSHTRPCTRAETARYAYTCLRVQGPCTHVYGTSTQPKTAVYTAVHGRVTCRVYGHVWAVSARVHGSVLAVCTAVFLPFSAVYIARTRPCNGPCTWPLHGRVQGPSAPCIR